MCCTASCEHMPETMSNLLRIVCIKQSRKIESVAPCSRLQTVLIMPDMVSFMNPSDLVWMVETMCTSQK